MTTSLIIATLVGYIALLFTVAFISARKSNNNDFFVGGRRSRWWVAMLAMVGAAMSGVTFVSAPGMVGSDGFAYMQMVLGFVVGYLIIAFVLVPLYYRMGRVSIYGYLEERLGTEAYKTGAWFFFISKLLGASVRLFVICAVLQPLLFDHFGLPFWVNCALAVALVWLYTFRGGVKSLVWTDTLKTLCLVSSIALSIYVVIDQLDLSLSELFTKIEEEGMGKVFYFDDVNDRRYFFKQFLAAIFIVVATTGLDQDMMQRTLSCRTARDSQKNLVLSTLLQGVVIFILLLLGALLYIFAKERGISWEGGSDNMFPTVATSSAMPLAAGVLFVLGLISSTYSAAGSALTALTTSFTIDLLGGDRNRDEASLARLRSWVHVAMAVAMFGVLVALHYLNSTNVIDAVYTLASYTYGPILGMFAFGILSRYKLRTRGVSIVAICAPAICLALQLTSEHWLGGYRFGYELLIVNALLTMVGMALLVKRTPKG